MTSTAVDRVNGARSSLAIKAPVKAATTANITLSGEQTIDGVSCVTGDRVLVKNQTTASQNGIYICDTSTWDRAPDFDGNNDVAKGTMVRVNQGSTNASGWFVVTADNPITIDTTSITWSRESINYIIAGTTTATAGQTLINTGTAYQAGGGGLAVYVNGLRQRITSDYDETSSTSFTMTYALQAGDEVDYYIGNAIGNLTASQASAVSVADAGDYYAGSTVEQILQEIASAITADVGNADATLTYNSSTRVQRWNTALTANRTATLSTSGAKEGANFVIVRGAGATGNFTLAVGSLCTLRAPGEWCEVRYDAGTAAWILEKYGILPSAEIMAMSSDNGDASATLTVGSSARTQRWATVLTADRTVTLSTTGAYTGARFRILRLEAATGLFSLIISAASATIARLAPGQWCDVEYTGSAWIVVASGDIREPNPYVITLTDDFLGEEIDGYKWQSLIGSNASCQQAILLQDQTRGMGRLTTGADAGGTMALNGCQLQGALNWSANQGGLVIEGRLLMSAITNVAVFFGFTDQVSALEMPFTLAAGDVLTSNATDAVGVLFDTGADTDNWWAVGVAADVDATKQNLAVAPVAATMEYWRIEITTAGVATFYRNGSLVGSAMTAALTASAQLTPVVVAFSRGAASRTIDVDFINVQAQR